MGTNARTNEMCNLVKEGIIDPTKVTITALESAASIAGLLLTTGVAIMMEDESQPDPYRR